MGDSHAPAVKILTLFLLITSVLGVGTKALTRAIIFRSLSLDDYLISTSLLFATAQSIAVFVQARYGYESTTLNHSQLVINLKSEYVASLFYIASLFFAKTSVLAFVTIITPVRIDQNIAYGLAGSIFLWAITAEFSTAFICHIPRPWDYLHGHCADHTIRHTLWNYFETSNIIIDVALIVFPSIIIWKIQIPKTKKALVISFFALRTFAIAASICKLVFWNQDRYARGSDPDPWIVTICTQAIQCLSIVSACFLYLKPFLDSVESGFMRSDDIRRRGTSDYYGHTAGGGSSSTRSAFSIKKIGQRGSAAIGLRNIAGGHNATTITAGEPLDNEVESQHSRSHFIKQTRTFAVEDSTCGPDAGGQKNHSV